jgi:hypothetical protein
MYIIILYVISIVKPHMIPRPSSDVVTKSEKVIPWSSSDVVTKSAEVCQFCNLVHFYNIYTYKKEKSYNIW